MSRTFGHEDATRATKETLGVIVRNHAITSFLETNEKRYLVGTKGSGKTLLLLRKALDQRQRGDAVCVPSDPNLPVDHLTASQHVGLKFHYRFSDPSTCQLAWATVWKHAIFCSVLHHLRDAVLAKFRADEEALLRSHKKQKDWLQEVEYKTLLASRALFEELLKGVAHLSGRPFDYYTQLTCRLDSASRQELDHVAEEVRKMDGLLQRFSRPVCVFLDNLDDYYEQQPELWFNSMYGQYRAIREISDNHRNIQVSTSFRKDIYEQFKDELHLQYFDYITFLEYRNEELLEIFETHIQDLDEDLLCFPALRETDPWRAFFGDCVIIRNEFVGVEERIQDYLLRHTLGRPRDMIHLGTVLLNNRPREGFNLDTVREAILAGERDIAKQYLAEIQVRLDDRFNIRDLIFSLPSNILNSAQLQQVASAFKHKQPDLYDECAPCDLTTPFEILYELGLLGCAEPTRDSGKILQHFLPPGQGLNSPGKRRLPESEVYVLHPIMTHLLPHQRLDNRFVVGNKLPIPRLTATYVNDRYSQ